MSLVGNLWAPIRLAALLGAGVFCQGLDSAPCRAEPVASGFIVEVYATVDLPMRLSFDESGSLFVGSNHPYPEPAPIHRIGPGGIPVQTYGPPLPDPDAVVVHDPESQVPAAAGSVLVGGVWDAGSGYVTEVLSDETGPFLWAPPSVCLNPSDFEFDSQGRLLFSDLYANAIFVCTDGDPVLLCSVPPRPDAIAIDADDRIFVRSDDGVIRIYDSSGTLVDDSFATGIPGFPGMAFGPGGAWGTDLYVVSDGDLLRLDPTGAVSVVGTGFSTGAVGIADLEFGPDGALYASDLPMNRILRIAPETTGVGSEIPLAGKPVLLRNSPNPFAYQTSIEFRLPRGGLTDVDIFDVSGRLIRRLVAGDLDAGTHALMWDGRNQAGGRAEPGAYFYRLRIGGVSMATRKAVIEP